ncbi:unnamed protein product [Closterium sp. Yama58-4]|nr:unnamed protein product [Closterium sp. Yama58-4]
MNRRLSTIILLAAAVFTASRISAVTAQASSSSPSYSSSYSSSSYSTPAYSSSPDNFSLSYNSSSINSSSYSSPSYNASSFSSISSGYSSSSSSSSPPQGPSTGGIVAMVVSVVLLLLGGVGIFLCCRRRNKASGLEAAEADLEANKGYANPYYAGGGIGGGIGGGSGEEHPSVSTRIGTQQHRVATKDFQREWAELPLSTPSHTFPPLSFGILILTTMSGRNAVKTDENGNSFNVRKWAESLVAAGKAEELKDPRLDAPANLILRMAQLALRCTATPTVSRPDMVQVVSELTALRKEFLGEVSSRMAERIDEEVESQRVGNFSAEMKRIEKLAFQDSTTQRHHATGASRSSSRSCRRSQPPSHNPSAGAPSAKRALHASASRAATTSSAISARAAPPFPLSSALGSADGGHMLTPRGARGSGARRSERANRARIEKVRVKLHRHANLLRTYASGLAKPSARPPSTASGGAARRCFRASTACPSQAVPSLRFGIPNLLQPGSMIRHFSRTPHNGIGAPFNEYPPRTVLLPLWTPACLSHATPRRNTPGERRRAPRALFAVSTFPACPQLITDPVAASAGATGAAEPSPSALFRFVLLVVGVPRAGIAGRAR